MATRPECLPTARAGSRLAHRVLRCGRRNDRTSAQGAGGVRSAEALAQKEIGRLDGELAKAEERYQEAATATSTDELADSLKIAAERVKSALDGYDRVTPRAGTVDKALAKVGLPAIEAEAKVKAIEHRLRLLRKVI